MLAIICPVCKRTNEASAAMCQWCHALLAEPDKFKVTTAAVPRIKVLPLEIRKFSRHVGRLHPDAVALYFNDIAEPILVEINRQAVIGRYSIHNSTQPRVDLNEYGAFQKGVSRLHAVIRRDKVLTIEDLGSQNGTWLNGTRLAPYCRQLIQNGDQIQFARLGCQIFFELTEQV